MSVERYRSVEHASGSVGRVRDPVEALDRMCELVALTPRGLPPLYRPGVYRYRSVEEAWEAREQRTMRRAREIRGRREVD